MLTLKNAFWVTLVLLNLVFILAVSYSRLKPTPEPSPHNEVVNQATSPDSSSWRFANMNTDIPTLELPSTSSPEPVSNVSETVNNNGSDTPALEKVEPKLVNYTPTASSDIEIPEEAAENSSVPATSKENFGATNSETASATPSNASGITNIEAVQKPLPDSARTTDSELASINISGETQVPTNVGNSASHEKVASSKFGSNTIEVAAASMATSRAIETALADTNKQLTEDNSNSEKANRENSQSQDANYKVDTYYDGNLVRTEETDTNGNLQITVKETMDGLANLPTNDAKYVEALEQLSKDQRAPKNNANEAVASHQAKESHSKKSVDYFNKVDVSPKNTQHPDNNLALADQIEAVVSAEDPSHQENSTPNKPKDDYFQALGTESAERTNEMRTIKIVRGDTLWSIASRAYGSGFEYKKIFKANPYLSDPDKIEVGDTLRVPI